MLSLGLNDKNGQELFAGDKVQIVNGRHSGAILYKIRAYPRAFTIEGNLSEKAEDTRTIHIACRKVLRLMPSGARRRVGGNAC